MPQSTPISANSTHPRPLTGRHLRSEPPRAPRPRYGHVNPRATDYGAVVARPMKAPSGKPSTAIPEKPIRS
ncbi:hypothetical protein GCM10009559_62250 [Pseudonocardia zijingensis]|uniref:Uncharacterized protein n=1 Tax=Pseudonocardia zijingensis TaxID=153376 RepID=A0ABN1N9R5_9PSEU